MLTKIRGIVLGTTRHSDRVNILSIYTDTHGRLSLIAPAGGTSRTARARRAALLPLTIIETDINIHANRSIQSLGKFCPLMQNSGICGNPIKSAIALFMAEFIAKALREAEPDINVWNFLVESIQVLNFTDSPANIHLAFLALFTRYAGIMPDLSAYTPHALFNLREGRYTDFTPVHRDFLQGNDAIAPVLLGKLSYSNFHRWHISTPTRRRLLQGLIDYYAIHLPGLDKLKSLDVLRQLFA